MESSRFDEFAMAVAEATSRRSLLQRVAGGAVAAGLALLGAAAGEEGIVDAKNGNRRAQSRKRKRGDRDDEDDEGDEGGDGDGNGNELGCRGRCTVTPKKLRGWQIVPDGTVPIEFSSAAASTGRGSLQFGPIAGMPGENKFIMWSPFQGPVSDLERFSYDFYIDQDSPGGAADGDQFYVNVYVDVSTNGIGFFGSGTSSTGFYDCRYDGVPPAGLPGGWTTYAFDQDTVWTNVANRSGNCTPTLGGLPDGSRIFLIALNGGDSSTGDAGLKGGYDNVVIEVNGKASTYDFEPKSREED